MLGSSSVINALAYLAALSLQAHQSFAEQQHRSSALSPALLQVISGDESGTICMWNIHTGERQGHFKRCHGNGRLTAMTLDAQERRLLTGSNSGELKMWNFNSGSQLREFAHREEHVEYSALRFVHDADRQSSLVRLKLTVTYLQTYLHLLA